MQIGEFAKICNTSISLLRHYDKVGVLVPSYTDKFTGYRHYSEEQISVFNRITALKEAGFSLQEIKCALESLQSDESLLVLFEKKKTDIKRTLSKLYSAQRTLVDEKLSIEVSIFDSHKGLQAQTTEFEPNLQNSARIIAQKILCEKEYQRISAFRTVGKKDSNLVCLTCDVIKLGEIKRQLKDNIKIPFENDDIVGKWEVLGEYAVKEDFYSDTCVNTKFYGERIKELVFLPRGEWYWCYSWTKGRILALFGADISSVNEYTVEIYNGEEYMFVDMKTESYRLGGKTTVVVLKRIDNIEYDIDDVARHDNVDLPFENDESVIGKWKVFDFCQTKSSFNPLRPYGAKLFWTEVEFRSGGELVKIYNYGKTVVGDKKKVAWTNGLVLDKIEKVTLAYEVRKIKGIEYLFVEWKTGDYIYGGMNPQYYVFVRNDED